MPATRPLTDSPWFWAYLFGTAALVALAIVNPKFNSRQAQIEREYQGRMRAAQNQGGVEPNVEMSAAGSTIIGLRPLFIGLAAVTAAAWITFWWNRRREQKTEDRRQPMTNVSSEHLLSSRLRPNPDPDS